MPNPIFTDAKVSALVRLYESGSSTLSLARQYGCNARTIANTLKRQGVEIRRRGATGLIENDAKLQKTVLTLRKQGLSYEKIAEKVPVCANAVGRFLRTQGLGDPLKAQGERHGLWKGGRTVTEGGYVLVWVAADHWLASMRTKTGYIPEHRFVMAEQLGRPLTQRETVHHIDGDRSNNAPDNLQLRQGQHGKHSRLRCVDCGSFNVVPVPL